MKVVTKHSEEDYDGVVRECTDPECSWEGTRSEAIEGTRGDWRCPECLGKIQSDSELEYHKRNGNGCDRKKVKQRIVAWLKENGNELGRKVFKIARVARTSSKIVNEIAKTDEMFEIIKLSSSNRVRLKRAETGW